MKMPMKRCDIFLNIRKLSLLVLLLAAFPAAFASASVPGESYQEFRQRMLGGFQKFR